MKNTEDVQVVGLDDCHNQIIVTIILNDIVIPIFKTQASLI